jgi:hypothetical protein
MGEDAVDFVKWVVWVGNGRLSRYINKTANDKLIRHRKRRGQEVSSGVQCLVGLLLERVGVFKESLTRSNHQYLGQRLDVRQVVLNGRFDSRYKYIKSTGNRQHTDGYFEWPPTPFYDVWCIDQR